MNRKTKDKSRCPGFTFVDTSSRTHNPRELGYMKPHICCFSDGNLSTVKEAPISARTEFGYAEFFIEVKPDPSHDFYIDPPRDASEEDRATHDFVNHGEDKALNKLRDRALGQHIAYVTEIMARQHRTFLFTISLSGCNARFIRWDRSGCLVSASFNIRQEPDILCDFLWRFSRTSALGRGHDPTVEVGSSAEEALFRDAITEHVRFQLELEDPQLEEAVSEHYKPGHVTAVHVLNHHQTVTADNVRRYIVSRPVISPLHLNGRGTRGYWALEASTRRVVFLKDTWQYYHPAGSEGDVLKSLNNKGVRNVPVFVWHGAVPDWIPDTECDLTSEFYYSHIRRS